MLDLVLNSMYAAVYRTQIDVYVNIYENVLSLANFHGVYGTTGKQTFSSWNSCELIFYIGPRVSNKGSSFGTNFW